MVVLLDQLFDRADISLIPEVSVSTEDSMFALEISPDETISPEDSSEIIIPDTSQKKDLRAVETKYVADSVLTAPSGFQNRFRTFCQKSDQAHQNEKVIRVLHLGDSQIEADRITDVLRSHFQDLYGGTGPGYIMPFDPLHVSANVRLTNKGNWNLEYSYREESFPGKIDFGFSGKAAWFSDKEGSISITQISSNPPRLRNYRKVRLLMTPKASSTRIRISENTRIIDDTVYRSSDTLQILKALYSQAPEKIIFNIYASPSPLFHGITLDGNSGVAVDNISLRGRPWPGIRLADRKMLKATGDHLNIGLIIMQFGTNILPTKTDDYNFYRIHFTRELKLLQEILPDVPVLVIGVQAAATSQGGNVEPLAHAKLISEAQKAAALACDMGFFDLHKAMGGKEGAVNWSKQNPPLMLSDYMHFSKKGAGIVGNKIWKTLDLLRIDLLSNMKSD